MPPKQAFEAVNKLLQDIVQTRAIFGDKIMVHGSDLRQMLAVVRRGGRAEVVSSCIKKSTLWRHQGTALGGQCRFRSAKFSRIPK
ncbi:hypothetical protein Aduo_013103 [Ancylostoma duodenale]